MQRHFMMVILLCWPLIVLASITTEISRSTIQLGEMFRLVINIDDPHTSGVPNLTPLQKNFTIVGTERSTAYSFVNGETHSVYQWIVLLMAKKTGMLDIPSIQIGKLESRASRIDVTPVKAVNVDGEESPAQDEVMLKTEISPGPVFINQQLIYTVKLYNSQRLLDVEYQPPRIDDALLIPLGDGHRSQTILNGHGYAVEEQQYAIFPQKSGELRIKPPSFKAVVFEAAPRQINVHAKSTSLVVKPIPAEYLGAPWFPAKQVALTETYDEPALTLNQGSTLVRTVTLQAAGVPAQLLPRLDFVSSPTFNAYPEKPELRNTARQQALIGRADVKVTYILNKEGRITIPALQVPWFNTDTGKSEIVSLPERVMDIIATKALPQATPTAVDNIKKPEPVLAKKPLQSLSSAKSNALVGWMAIGFGLVCLVMFMLWHFCKRSVGRGRIRRLALKKLHRQILFVFL